MPTGIRGWEWLALLALLLTAVLLRRGSLSPSSLWVDDAWVAAVARADTAAEIWRVSFLTPGFSVLLDRWIDLVGFSEVKAQLVPLAAGLAIPVVGYVLWRRDLGRPGALLASSILVTSPVLITYSTRVKAYTFDALIATLLLCVALALLRANDDASWWSGLVASAVAATLVSPTIIPVATGVLIACAAATVRRDHACWRRPLLAGGAYAVFAALWGPLYLLPRQQDALIRFWDGYFIPVEDGLGAVRSTYELLAEVGGGLAPLPGWLVLGCLAAGTGLLARREPDLALLGCGPLVVGIVFSAAQRMPLGGGRTDAVLYPSLALLAGASLKVVGERRVQTAVAVVLATVLVVCAPVARPARECARLTPVDERGRFVHLPPAPLDAVACYPNWDLAPFIAQVEAEAGPDDLVLVHPLSRWAYALYTRAPVGFVPDDVYGTGFDVRVHDERVHILDGTTPLSENPGVIREAPRVWYVGADGDDAFGVRLNTRLELARLGYTLTEDRGYDWRRFTDRELGPEGVAWMEQWISTDHVTAP